VPARIWVLSSRGAKAAIKMVSVPPLLACCWTAAADPGEADPGEVVDEQDEQIPHNTATAAARHQTRRTNAITASQRLGTHSLHSWSESVREAFGTSTDDWRDLPASCRHLVFSLTLSQSEWAMRQSSVVAAARWIP